MAKKKDLNVEKEFGNKLRKARLLKGRSQEWLGHQVGLTFQQIQKYEKGTNRISVSRLLQFCDALEVPPSFFLEEREAPPDLIKMNKAVDDFLTTIDGITIVKSWPYISKGARKVLMLLIENISKSGAEADVGKL